MFLKSLILELEINNIISMIKIKREQNKKTRKKKNEADFGVEEIRVN